MKISDLIAVRLIKLGQLSCEKVELSKPEAGQETYLTGERTLLNHRQVMIDLLRTKSSTLIEHIKYK